MPNTVVEQPGYLIIIEAKTKCYMEIHKEHFYHRNPSGFILLWLQSVHAVPVSEQETDTDEVAHRSSFTVYDLPSVPPFIACYNDPLFPFLSKLQKLTLSRGNSSCGSLPFLCCDFGFITTGENKTVSSCFQLRYCVSQQH